MLRKRRFKKDQQRQSKPVISLSSETTEIGSLPENPQGHVMKRIEEVKQSAGTVQTINIVTYWFS